MNQNLTAQMEHILEAKWQRASDHLEKMKQALDDEVEFHAQFTCYLTNVRTIPNYIARATRADGRCPNKETWKNFIDPWENRLQTEDKSKWQLVLELREKDFHDEPIDAALHESGYWGEGYWGRGYWGRGYWGAVWRRRVTDPNTNKRYDVIDLCEAALRVARQLIKDFRLLPHGSCDPII